MPIDTSQHELTTMLWMTFWLLLPVIIALGVTTILVSLVQLITGLQDQTLSTIPRLLVAFLTLLLWLKWAAPRLTAYTATAIQQMTPHASR
jgi:flagellar biosynthetic protein FliQ